MDAAALSMRIAGSQHVDVRFAFVAGDRAYFDVIKPGTDTAKYAGRVRLRPDPQGDYCTCPDNIYRNNDAYKASNAAPYRCKHQLAAIAFLERNLTSWSPVPDTAQAVTTITGPPREGCVLHGGAGKTAGAGGFDNNVAEALA